MMFRGRLGQAGSIGRLAGSVGRLASSVKSGWQKIPGSAKIGAGAGLMTGIAGGAISGAASGGRSVIDAGKRNGATLFVFLSILLFLFDVTIGYKGFNIVRIGSITEILKFVSSLGYVIGLWAFFYFFVSKERDVRALASSIIALIIVIFSLTVAFGYDRIVILHIIFILIFWVGFIMPREDAATANILLIVLLIADLYLFSIINVFSPSLAGTLKGFPFLFILTIFFVYEQTNSKLALISIFGVFAWYFITAGPDLAQHFGLVDIEAIKTEIPPPKEMFEQAKKKIVDDTIKKIRKSIDAWLSERIQYAVTGKVEENKVEPLGVYLENVQSADKKYYEDEDVIVFGTVKARTLDDPINIDVGCFVKDGDNKKIADKIDPPKKFSVFTLEEVDFACTFGSCKGPSLNLSIQCEDFCDPQKDAGCKTVVDRKILKIGENSITTFADFNFETLAYQKVYFINRERQRAMAREGLDPFAEFDIKDRNPIAVYTNGPAKIEMGTNSPLVAVSDQYIVQPSLDVSIANREGWQGKIKKLKELVIFLPEGMTIDTEMGGCNKKFKIYGVNDCKKDSCEDIVKKECLDVCGGYDSGSARDSCERECNDNFVKCQNSCDYFFREGEQSYTGYALQNASSQREKEFKEGLAVRCRFRPTLDVLGSSPFTTKSFRVKIRYDYTVEKPVSVSIEEVPGVKGSNRDIGTNYTGTNEIVRMIYDVAGDNALGEVMAVGAYLESRWDRNAVNNGLCKGPCGTICGYDARGRPIMKEYSCGLFQFNICGGMGTPRPPCQFTDEDQQCGCWQEKFTEEAVLIKPNFVDAKANSESTPGTPEWYCNIWRDAEGNAANCADGSTLANVQNAVAMVRGSTSTMTT